jgi:hypothetical protein
MKKEDLIVGEWYKSNSWNETAIAKFQSYEYQKFWFKEAYINAQIKNKKVNGDFFYSTLDNLVKATEEEIQRLLPDNHPDKNIRYVKCVKPYNNYGIVDVIYKKIGILIYTSEGKSFQNSHNDTTILEWFIPSTKEAYDLQDNISNELTEFPKEGYCKNTSEKFRNFLINKFPGIVCQYGPNTIGYSWSEKSFCDITINSSKKEYKIEELWKFFEPKTNKDLTEFPESGYCIEKSAGLEFYLKSNKLHSGDAKPDMQECLTWERDNTWCKTAISYPRYKKLKQYTLTELNNIINQNSNQNDTEKSNSKIRNNNKVRTIENKIARTIVGRTVTMGPGGQQGSIGSRPEGNKAFIDNGGTRIGRAEIRASARFRQNP